MLGRENLVHENGLHRINAQSCIHQTALPQRLSKRRIGCLRRSAVAMMLASLKKWLTVIFAPEVAATNLRRGSDKIETQDEDTTQTSPAKSSSRFRTRPLALPRLPKHWRRCSQERPSRRRSRLGKSERWSRRNYSLS